MLALIFNKLEIYVASYPSSNNFLICKITLLSFHMVNIINLKRFFTEGAIITLITRTSISIFSYLNVTIAIAADWIYFSTHFHLINNHFFNVHIINNQCL